MKFLVVIPTIRQKLKGFEEVMDSVRASFTQPTEFHILDGSEGKSQALNKAFDELLVPSDCDVYVTIDDDYLPGEAWQDTLVAAFDAFPRVGAFGLWLGDDPEMLKLMGAHLIGPEERKGAVRFRRIGPAHHINGALIAFRKEVAVAVGKLPDSDLKYQLWEDAYRTRRVRVVGKEIMYAVGAIPKLIEYEDTPEYVAEKARETAVGGKQSANFLAQGGIREPLSLQVRRVVGGAKARLLGRKGGR
ncbi:MAG TPA: hypothetical protein VG820_13535 [Fimbriimonadaceae bacterium]|nr:hypothetical protein [Fimbriimonadaceae bacterium]